MIKIKSLLLAISVVTFCLGSASIHYNSLITSQEKNFLVLQQTQERKLLLLQETLEKNQAQISSDLMMLKLQQQQIASKTVNVIAGVGQDNTIGYIYLSLFIVIIVLGVCYIRFNVASEGAKTVAAIDLEKLKAAESTGKAITNQTSSAAEAIIDGIEFNNTVNLDGVSTITDHISQLQSLMIENQRILLKIADAMSLSNSTTSSSASIDLPYLEQVTTDLITNSSVSALASNEIMNAFIRP